MTEIWLSTMRHRISIAFRGPVRKSLRATEERPTYRSPNLARLGRSEIKNTDQKWKDQNHIRQRQPSYPL